jgi:hypothetical protein
VRRADEQEQGGAHEANHERERGPPGRSGLDVEPGNQRHSDFGVNRAALDRQPQGAGASLRRARPVDEESRVRYAEEINILEAHHAVSDSERIRLGTSGRPHLVDHRIRPLVRRRRYPEGRGHEVAADAMHQRHHEAEQEDR